MAINGNGREKSGQKFKQLSLRDQVRMDPTDLLKTSMAEAIKNSGLSRAQVVDEMNRLAAIAGIGVRTTEAILDKWLARGSRNHLISVRDLPIFCQTVGSILPLRALLPAGADVVSGDDLALLRWAKAEAERIRASKAARRLAEEAGIR
jgi:hypothetical protein